MSDVHEITIGQVRRQLPIREVAPGIRVALFSVLGDWELTEAAGTELARRIPEGTEVLLMPDGKAQSLLHVVGREAKLPTVVARKERKAYLLEPVTEVHVRSITTHRMQRLVLGSDEAERLRGRRVVMVDDVVSTGGTLEAVMELLERVGGKLHGVMAVFSEGTPRSDVITLGHLPLF
jgi:adenine phosphoribosyltransferase